MKYSYEKKLEVVMSVERGEHSVYSAAHYFGVSRTPLQRWVARYQAMGEKGLRHTIRSYSAEFKLSVLDYIRQNHLSLLDTAVKFDIPSESMIHRWEQAYRMYGIEGLLAKKGGGSPRIMNDKKLKVIQSGSVQSSESALLAENERLRAEVAYLKK